MLFISISPAGELVILLYCAVYTLLIDSNFHTLAQIFLGLIVVDSSSRLAAKVMIISGPVL
jgi:hypothetical protein